MFESETGKRDHLAQLVTYLHRQGLDCMTALQQTLERIEGSYGLVVLFRIIPISSSPPARRSLVVIGQGESGFMFPLMRTLWHPWRPAFLHLGQRNRAHDADPT